MGIKENKIRGLDIEEREYIKKYFFAELYNIFSTDSECKVEPHQRHNDPYDFIVKIKKNGRVYTKYIEIKSGNAQLSKIHSNFIVNKGNATSNDIEKLGEQIIQKVYEKFGIKLAWEIKIIGRKGIC